MIDYKQIKVDDKINATCETTGKKRKDEVVTRAGELSVKTKNYTFFFSEITAVNSSVKTYDGQFETCDGLTFDKMLDSLPF